MKTNLKTRIGKTLPLIKKSINYLNLESESLNVLDMGSTNYMREHLEKNTALNFIGTKDIDLNKISQGDLEEFKHVDLITSFEVFEHLYNLYPLLVELRRLNKPIIFSVPHRFALTKLHWGPNYYTRHYNEFEERQFRWIAKEANYEVVNLEKWKMDLNVSGIRTFLRTFIGTTWIAGLMLPIKN